MKKIKNKSGVKQNSKKAAQKRISSQVLIVKNAAGDPDTKAKIEVQNRINYIPKVSVIIPVYNVQNYLRPCLDSVLNQTLKEIEIICVDDGSTDGSLEILKQYAAKDNRITVLKQKNLHAGVARNAGLAVARGEYLSFLDSDDFFELNMLEEIHKTASFEQADIVYYGWKQYDNKEQKISFSYLPIAGNRSKVSIISNRLVNITPTPWTKLFRTKFIKTNNLYFENFASTNDLTFVYTALSLTDKISILNRSFVMYRTKREGNISLKRGMKIENYILAIQRLKHNLEKYNKFSDLQHSFVEMVINTASWELKQCFDNDLYNKVLIELSKIIPGEAVDIIKEKIKSKVSVIIPVYNVEQYLRKCLDTVINQTFKEIEIICINDGSTDNSLNILNEYAGRDRRIVILNQKNQGAGASRNYGVKRARSPFVFFVDSDDWIDLNCVDKLYKKITQTQSDICILGLQIYDEKNNTLKQDSYFDTSCYKNRKHEVCNYKEIKNFIFRRFAPYLKLYNKNFFINNNLFFDTTMYFEDVVPHVKAMLLANRISFLDENLYFYRSNRSTSMMGSAKSSLKVMDAFIYFTQIEQFIFDHHLEQELGLQFRNFFYEQIQYHTTRITDQQIKSLFIAKAKEYKKTSPLLNPLKVSVIIPVYNAAQFLPQCLDSIINQTLKEIEIICVNDGSTDNSLEILNAYEKKDKRIIIINQDNQRQGAARNRGLKIARGEYVQFVDSDDWLHPECLERLYEKAKKFNLQMLHFEGQNFSDGTYYQTEGLKINYATNENQVYSHQDVQGFLIRIPISACLIFYQYDFLKDNQIFFPEKVLFEDNYFMHKALNAVKRFGIMKTILYNRRKHLAQTTANWDEHYSDYIKIVGMIIHLYTKEFKANYTLSTNIINQYCSGLAYRYSSVKNKPKHQRELCQLFNTIPQDIKLSEYVLHFINEVKFSQGYKTQLKQWYQKVTGKYLNLDNPRTFNEKMQWLKLYDSTPLKTRLADKYLVREWIKEKIGEQYLIPLIGVYDKFDDIDFDKLPNQFVMKCNHGSGWNIIVKDKSQLNLAEAKQKMDRWMATDYSILCGYELHYRNIVPKIIIEKYMEEVATALYDYRFFCSYGDVKQIWLDVYSGTPNHKRKIYDRNWNELNITVKWPRLETPVEKPQKLADMIRFAEILSKEFSLVRVDFYLIGNHIYFGEMTFTSMSGIGQFNPEKEDLKLGNMIKLPELAYNLETGEYYKLPKKSRLKPYVLFPYYLWKKFFLNKQKEKYTQQQVWAELAGIRLDIKNAGQAQNAVEIDTTEKLSQPAWFSNAQGQGQVLESCRPHLRFNIKAVHPGKLSLVFRGKDRRFGKERVAAWVDYTSIKINGQEILSRPVAVWHDKPFRYDMPVKDGQTVLIEIEQQPHQYSRNELKGLVLKLFAKNDYVKAHVEAILKHCSAFIRPEDKRPSRWFSVTNTGVQKTVYILGLKLTVQNKQAALRQLLQQQQALLQAVQAASGKNNALEQRYAALASQLTSVQHEVQQAKLWIKQTYEAFPTVNKQLSNAQDALLSQLVTEKKVNRLAAITSVELKKQRKHNQEMKQMLSKFVADTQVDLRYLRNMDVAKNERLQQASKQLAQQMRELFQKQDEQLADMQKLLASGENTLQHLKGIDVAEAQQLKQTEEELTQRIAEAAGAQSELLSSVSVALRKQQEEGLQKTGNLYLSLETLNKTGQKTQAELQKQLCTLQDKSLRQYHELNFADLLHDSTQHSPWLKNKNFSLYGWAANYSFIYTLFRILDKVSPRYILEMGLGQTTRLTSQYVAYKNPAATLDVCEHNQSWIDIYTPELPRSEHIHVHHLELEYFDFEGKPNDKYKDIAKVTGNTQYNLIIVDGPVGGGKNFPRSNIVDLVPQNLAKDFIIIFDDAERAGEQKTIEQTKARLAENGIVFATQQRNGAKSQFLIFSQSLEFVQYL